MGDVVVTSEYVRYQLAECGVTFTDDEWRRAWDAEQYDTKVTMLGMSGAQYARMTGVTDVREANDGDQ